MNALWTLAVQSEVALPALLQAEIIRHRLVPEVDLEDSRCVPREARPGNPDDVTNCEPRLALDSDYSADAFVRSSEG